MKLNSDNVAYAAYNYEVNKSFIERSLVLAVVLFLAFGILDYVLFPSIFFKLARIRYGIFLPVTALFFLIIKKDIFKKNLGLLVSIVILAASIITNLMQVASGPLGYNVYFSGQLVIMLYLFTGSKITFKLSVMTGACIIIFYNITMLHTKPEFFEVFLLLKDNTFLVTSFILGSITSYSLEQYLIKDYLEDKKTNSKLNDEISQRRYKEEQLNYLVSHDELTGLYNRRFFSEHLSLLIEQDIENRKKITVILMDIDQFKIINDSLGHDMGDKVLIKIAEKLKTLNLDQGLIARMGGDEFGVLINNETTVDDLLSKLLKMFQDPVEIFPHHFHVSTSIGVSFFPTHRITSDELIRCAETAMYQAKDNGKNRIEYFSEKYDLEIQKRGLIARKLKNALHENNFFMVYQQKLSSEQGKLQGLEALIRWEDPDEGLIPPDFFIKVAEETGQISALGEWVLNTSCKEFMQLPISRRKDLKLSVNLSTIELQQEGIAERVDHILKKYAMPPANLCLEITESAIIQSIDCVLEAISQFKKIGVEVSIDDFGTGFSSLAYLSKLDVEELKIDRSFIMKIGTKEDDMIVRTIAALGKGLKLRVVAEGVETQEQVDFLKVAGVDILQGYLHGKPLRIEKWLEYFEPNPPKTIQEVMVYEG